jgi:hypothetical protein
MEKQITTPTTPGKGVTSSDLFGGYTYGPWKCHPIAQLPHVGSRWYRGNFSLGLKVDSHPRFVNVICCFWFIEIGLGLTREIQPNPQAEQPAPTTKGEAHE